MERSRLLQCLAADYMRLREVAGAGLTAKVPSCPGWTVADLVRHVGQVYLHKAEVLRTGAWPEQWPPPEIATENPIALLDRGYGAVTHEFSRRGDADHALTWHDPDQTVKFWIRRMAQESVIHRLDAELAHHTESAPIPPDLARDGIDEVLRLFLSYGSHTWQEDFAPALSKATGYDIRIQAAGDPAVITDAWLIRTGSEGVSVTSASPNRTIADSQPDATVTGPPAEILRWLWARESNPTTDVHQPIRVEGNEEAITELRSLLTAGTQ
ncbi:maleylpyruvate isomerase family mycothiol-dependent enzyme [Dactylosporangium sp. CA-233914]|uniref:maleylpyruvate isomerase family mycothiol-dependent enzyme n=1 Tax=Dactylosporangium sp. CA-233914 TaxID=3239934 RepID=UPI003D8B1876